MKNLNELYRQNAEMPKEEWEELRAGFIRPLQDQLVGRRLLPIRRLPRTAQVFSYDRIKSEPGPATVIAKGAVYPLHEYSIERVSVPIPKFGWGFQIPMEDYESGTILNEQVAWARRKMAEKEDDLIFNGEPSMNIGGLLDFAGNTYASSGWVTGVTVERIYNDVRELIKLFRADKVMGPYTMVLHPDDAHALTLFDTTSQRVARTLVETLVSQIHISYTLPSGTALLMQTGDEIAQLGVKEDITLVRPFWDEEREVWRGKARAQLIPIVYQYGDTAGKSDAIGTLTNLNA